MNALDKIEYPAELQRFIKRMDAGMEAELDKPGTIGDIRINFNGDVIAVPLNADSYCRLKTFMEQELTEIAIDTRDIAFIGEFQKAYVDRTASFAEWFIVFTHFNEYIVNPFESTMDPVALYSTSYLQSGWFTSGYSLVSRIKNTMHDVINYLDKDADINHGASLFETFNIFFALVAWDLHDGGTYTLQAVMDAGDNYYKAQLLLMQLATLEPQSKALIDAMDCVARFGLKSFGRRYYIKSEV